jgi:peptidoglycan-N-acetylglucosamine deacetylase
VDRWNWTWEEPHATAAPEKKQAADAPPKQAPAPAHAHTTAFRRRRIGAGLALVLILAVLIGVLGRGGGHSAARSSSGAHAAAHGAAATPLSAAQQEALADQSENRAIDRVLAYTPAITHGGAKGNEVALTFDDGPGPYTERLVEELNSLRVKATFFAIGEEERYFSGGTLLELRSGDAVGDHTETHPMLASMSRHEQHEELFEQIARIELLGGPRPRLFRPPYGSFNATTFNELHALRLLMVLWSTDTRDYTRPGVAAIVESALAGAHPGAIILMHDAGGERSETIAALPEIIAGLRKRGLRAVTVPRMMLDDPPPPGLPIPTSLTGD